jgi:hypothetical protein
MSYSDFTLSDVQSKFGIEVETVPRLFGQVPPVALTPYVQELLREQLPLALANNTEKGRAEWLIAPLLGEFWRRCGGRISVFSGLPLDVDAELGLVGRADFLIGLPPQLHYVTSPLMAIIEAKNDDIAGGLGQCAAVMVGAQLFNQKHKKPIAIIHGCVSDGAQWKFLKLVGKKLTIDLMEYQITQADQILGILMHIAGPLSDGLAA